MVSHTKDLLKCFLKVVTPALQPGSEEPFLTAMISHCIITPHAFQSRWLSGKIFSTQLVEGIVSSHGKVWGYR